jgi:hypothetical protein
MRTLEKSAINFLIADRTETVYSTESSKGQVQLQESAKEFFNLLVTHHYLSADNSEKTIETYTELLRTLANLLQRPEDASAAKIAACLANGNWDLQKVLTPSEVSQLAVMIGEKQSAEESDGDFADRLSNALCPYEITR